MATGESSRTASHDAAAAEAEETTEKCLQENIKQLEERLEKEKMEFLEMLKNEESEEAIENFHRNPMRSILLAKERFLKFQLDAASQQKLKVLDNDPELLVKALNDELDEAIKQATDHNILCETMMNELKVKNDIVALQIEKDTKVVEALQSKLDQKLAEKKISAENAQKEKEMQLKGEIKDLRLRADKLSNLMRDFMEKHFPPPGDDEDNERSEPGKKKKPPFDKSKMKTLQELVELLVNVYMDTPESPYIRMDDTWWPPYIELLLRNNIALLHPKDKQRICLEYVE